VTREDEAEQERLPQDVARALGDMGLLVPERDSEVLGAEQRGEAEVELPERLGSFSGYRRASDAGVAPPAGKVVPLQRPAQRGGNLVRYAVGFALGAAATVMVWLSRPEPVTVPPIGGATGELREPKPPEQKAPIAVDLATQCTNCCAGSGCSSAPADARSCPSGRSCVECEPSADSNVFKLRLSALGLSDEGRGWFAQQGLALEQLLVCADAHGRALGCRSAIGQPGDLVQWSSLPVASTTSQLVGGLGVHLRKSESGSDLASFTSAVSVSPDTLCRGVAARLASPDGTVVGKVSAFFDDIHFVELARAATVKQLLDQEQRYAFSGGLPDVYETRGEAERRFALVIGPLPQSAATAIRWQLLDQGAEGELTFGDDHVGPPRPR
jgi:hypothetical protein